MFKIFKPKEYLMVNAEGVQQFVLDTAIQKRMENGWVLYTESGRDAPDYYVPDIFQFFGKMSFGKLPGIKLIQTLFRIHKSYKNDLNFLDIAWGTFCLGKLPTISFMKEVIRQWHSELTDIARFIANFIIGLVLVTPVCVLAGWAFVECLLLK